MEDKKKKLGQVFTPDWIVDLILDKIDYKGVQILDKYVFEPGCGNGNFLVSIVDRFIETAKKKQYTQSKIKNGLEKYIYGVEVDKEVYLFCIQRLNEIAEKHNLKNIKWNIYNTDILDLETKKLPEFDFVIGNPPYVRIHNLDKNRLSEIKSRFHFCKNGIIDLFLVFFEIGIMSLKQDGGKLGFITPNSFIHNSTYVDFRKYLVEHNLIKDLINFKENSVFDDASTYNAITILDTIHGSKFIDYYEYVNNKISLINKIDLEKQDLKKWNFTNTQNAEFLEGIKNGKHKISDFAVVQYGFATLLDKAYLVKDDTLFSFSNEEKDVIYPVVKASRYDGGIITDKIIYPYFKKDKSWIPIPEEEFKNKFPKTYDYLLRNKEALKKRSCDKSVKFWYEYGRSQGIQTIHNEKLVISPIFKNKIKVFKVDKKTMVYSGIYLFMKENSKYTINDIKKIIESEDFIKYARILGKDMRGGYKNINTKAIKDFAINR